MDGLATQAGMVRRGGFDADAAAYFAAIASAGSSISAANKTAVNDFVVGCKADGTWSAIKASCLLAGPDDLTGALVPLVGAAPTNNGFVSGDYSRTTGLKGDGSTKYLNSNRNNNADPRNSKHIAVWQHSGETRSVTRAAMGTDSGSGGSLLLTSATSRFFWANSGTSVADTSEASGLWGVSRASSSGVVHRFGGASATVATSSLSPLDDDLDIYRRGTSAYTTSRISFYSIGESLDLALLDARLTTYMAALT